jgi:hypothetical protein
MADKPTARRAKSRRSNTNPSAKRGQKLILGGVILILVLVAGTAIRSWKQRNLPLRLQGALDNHYSKGIPGALVVMKEFSDYT